jgi:hypothetical protein
MYLMDHFLVKNADKTKNEHNNRINHDWIGKYGSLGIAVN